MRSFAVLYFIATCVLSCGTREQEDKIIESLPPTHNIDRIVCSNGISIPHHIEIQRNGHVIYRGMGLSFKVDSMFDFDDLYIGKIETTQFDEIALRLIDQNYINIDDFESPHLRPTPGNYLHAHIYYDDTVKFLSHFNDSITEILVDILDLRFDANLKLAIRNSHKVFETEIPPPPCE